MIGSYTAQQARAAEAARQREVPDGYLMQIASYGLAQAVLRLLAQRTGGAYGRAVLLLVGPGGNGGDALHCGAFLRRRGVDVTAVLVREQTHPGALPAYLSAGGTVLDAAELTAAITSAEVVVDGIAGLGSGRAVGLSASATEALAAHEAVVAVDLPSGVSVDTGAVADDAVHAAVTVTFGCAKNAHFLAPAAAHCGRIELVDIGLGPHLPRADAGVLTTDEVYDAWPRQPYDGHKYSTGVVGIVAGSAKYPGAAVLSVGGAVRAKPGMVRYVGPQQPAGRVIDAWPEAVVESSVAAAGRTQAWVVGPGIGTDARAERLLEAVLSSDVPAVVDADGLTLLAGRVGELGQRTAPTVLTPHAGEFERIFFGIDDPLSAARRAADESGCVVLLKGPTTVVAAPGAPALINPSGTSRLATAGTGDVLAGVLGALLAAGIEPRRAAAMAAYAHGAAAASARFTPSASDLPALLRELLAARLD